MNKFSLADQKTLLKIAHDSIAEGFKTGKPLSIALIDYPNHLQENRATFVTIHVNHELHGCIGALEAYQPLVEDIAEHAFGAAFDDPRFPPLTHSEFKEAQIEISVLSKTEPMTVKSEEDLLHQLRPGIDGLILIEGGYRATFLPSVWEELADPRTFLSHLKMKAGLAPNYWSPTIHFERYYADKIS